jgi:hypothetical protein
MIGGRGGASSTLRVVDPFDDGRSLDIQEERRSTGATTSTAVVSDPAVFTLLLKVPSELPPLEFLILFIAFATSREASTLDVPIFATLLSCLRRHRFCHET